MKLKSLLLIATLLSISVIISVSFVPRAEAIQSHQEEPPTFTSIIYLPMILRNSAPTPVPEMFWLRVTTINLSGSVRVEVFNYGGRYVSGCTVPDNSTRNCLSLPVDGTYTVLAYPENQSCTTPFFPFVSVTNGHITIACHGS